MSIKQKRIQKKQRASKRREKNRKNRSIELKRLRGAKSHIIRAFQRHGSYDPIKKKLGEYADTSSVPVRIALAVYGLLRIVRHNKRQIDGRLVHRNDSKSRKHLGEYERGGYLRDLIAKVNKDDGTITPIREEDILFLQERSGFILATHRPCDIAYKVAELVKEVVTKENVARAMADEQGYREERRLMLWECHKVVIWDGKGKNEMPWCRIPAPRLDFYFTNKRGKLKRIGALPYDAGEKVMEEEHLKELPQARRAIELHIRYLNVRFFRGEVDLEVLEKGGIKEWWEFNQKLREKEREEKQEQKRQRRSQKSLNPAP